FLVVLFILCFTTFAACSDIACDGSRWKLWRCNSSCNYRRGGCRATLCSGRCFACSCGKVGVIVIGLVLRAFVQMFRRSLMLGISNRTIVTALSLCPFLRVLH